MVFGVTALGAFMAALDLSIVNVAFPDLEASYPNASQASLAWVITAYARVRCVARDWGSHGATE